MITKSRSLRFATMPQEYSKLVAMFPPRPIHDAADAANVSEVIAAMHGHRLNSDQRDYLRLLFSIYSTWKESCPQKPQPKVPPHELIEFMMEQHDMNQTDLAKLLGVRPSLVSMMLAGKRSFSKASIKILTQRFGVEAGTFL